MASAAADGGSITVEVIYATPAEQVLHTVQLPAGSTVGDALSAAFAGRDVALKLETLAVGVWGKVVDRLSVLRDGDRIELYRPLLRDPRDARRELAAAGKVMSEPRRGDDEE